MIRHINADQEWRSLSDAIPWAHKIPPRRTLYGTADAAEVGLTPFHEAVETRPDLLIPADALPAAIEQAHADQTFPLYHQYRTWAPKGHFNSNQNGLGYCWTWSGTAALMDCMAIEDKEFPELAPVSMGYLVDWRNRGNYLESFIKGARQDGICPGPFNSTDRSPATWASTDRAKYRLARVWDTDTRKGDAHTIRQIVSMLVYGAPCYIAYNWWGHALEMVAARWDSSSAYPFVPIIRNSHDENDVIEVTGRRAIPDECFAFVSTRQFTEPRQ